MFNKKSLSLAVAAAATGLSLSAMGAIDVTEDTGKVAIAFETVTPATSGALPVGGNTTGVLDVSGELGVGIADGDRVVIRVDWSSAVLNAAFTPGSLDVGGTDATTLTEGLAGDDFAVFSVTPGAGGFSQTDMVELTMNTAGISLTGAATDVRMRLYESQGAALREDAALVDQTSTGAISLGNALGVTFAPATVTAEVITSFTQFVGGSSVGALGRFTAGASTSFVLAAGLADIESLADVVDESESTVTYNGDFSFVTGSTSYAVGTSGSCTAGLVGVKVNTTSFASATTTLTTANGNPLCVTVNGRTDVIPAAMYTASVNLVHKVTTSRPAATTGAGVIGNIVRNGTSVEVAYLTTFADYNQRLLLNSRHSVAAAYSVTFQTETGVTATALDAATGTLQPGENLILRAADLVTLTGGTRCSATVTVVAPDAAISVATTQVNLADASTDTVSYN